MFDDLTNVSLNPIYTRNVKSYPSINSPNSGGFNDEINMKWISKKFTSKPFIVNPDTDFIKTKQTAKTLTVTSGSVCIDGYMIKLSSSGNTNFDSDTSGSVSFNTQYIQRFVNNLTGTGTDTPLKTNLSQILFSEYDPNTVQDDDYSTINSNWETAKANNLCVGYVCLIYKDTYLEELSVTQNLVSYKDTKIVNKQNNSAYEEISYTSTPEEIRTAIQNDSVVGFEVGDPFAIASSNEVAIFYPIKYDMTFTDIFGFVFSFKSSIQESKLYPYTDSPNIDMLRNETLGTFTNCNLSTLPRHIYDFESLYDSNQERYSIGDSGFNGISSTVSYNINPFDTLTDNLARYTLQELLGNYIPSNYGTLSEKILEVNNELEYYCLNLEGTTYKENQLSIENNQGESVLIPVVFIASNGQLCPNGIIANGSNNTYPAEGYLHFVKRNYIIISGGSPTESNISSVTINQITSTTNPNWTTWFTDFYSNVLAKVICAYIQVGYSSILDNVVRYNNQPDTGYTDSVNIKSIGCGVALSTYSGVQVEDFETIKPYSLYGYLYNETTNTFNSNQISININYYKDLTSDYTKIKNCLTDNKITSVLTPFNYYKELDFTDNKLMALSVEDPIHFLRRCVITSGGNKINTKLYKISGSSIIQCSGLNSSISNMQVDNNLMPKLPITQFGDDDCSILLRTHQTESSTNIIEYTSMISGICVQFNKYEWSMSIPTYLQIYKDGKNYLAGKDFLNPDEYLGCKIIFGVPGQQPENSAFLFNLEVPTKSTNVYPDNESKFIGVDTTSADAKLGREAYIEIDRVYDPDGPSSLEAFIQNMISGTESTIQQMQQTINSLQTFIDRYATIMYYHKRIHIGDFNAGGTSRPTPVTQGIQSNSRIALKIDLYETADVDNKLDIYSLIVYQVTDTPEGTPTNYHSYNEDVKVDYYYSQGKDLIPKFGTVLITNTSNDSIDNILFDFQIYREKYSTLLPTDVSCNITTLAAITLDTNDLHKTLSVGDTDAITVDSTIPANQAVTWSSDNTDVVTVDQSGNITAVAAGTAKVTASLEVENATVYTSCEITVE